MTWLCPDWPLNIPDNAWDIEGTSIYSLARSYGCDTFRSTINVNAEDDHDSTDEATCVIHNIEATWDEGEPFEELRSHGFFTCDSCELAFQNRDTLSDHEDDHEDDIPFIARNPYRPRPTRPAIHTSHTGWAQ